MGKLSVYATKYGLFASEIAQEGNMGQTQAKSESVRRINHNQSKIINEAQLDEKDDLQIYKPELKIEDKFELKRSNVSESGKNYSTIKDLKYHNFMHIFDGLDLEDLVKIYEIKNILIHNVTEKYVKQSPIPHVVEWNWFG